MHSIYERRWRDHFLTIKFTLKNQQTGPGKSGTLGLRDSMCYFYVNFEFQIFGLTF